MNKSVILLALFCLVAFQAKPEPLKISHVGTGVFALISLVNFYSYIKYFYKGYHTVDDRVAGDHYRLSEESLKLSVLTAILSLICYKCSR